MVAIPEGQKDGHARSLFVMILVFLFFLFAIWSYYSRATVRFRVTAKINDKGVTREGSSIWSFRLSQATAFDSSYASEFHGEAISVRLSNGGILLVLPMGYRVTYSVAEMLPEQLFYSARNPNDRIAEVKEISKQLGTSKLTRCSYNVVSTERIVADPRGPNADCLAVAFLRPPGGMHDLVSVPLGGLAATAGPGITIQSVDVTITSDTATPHIADQISWINELPDTRHGYDTFQLRKYNLPTEAFFLRR